MIATPCHDGRIDVHYADSLVGTIALCRDNDIAVHPIYMPYDALVQRARNDLVAIALGSMVDDVLFIDADQAWRPQDALRLLQHQVDVVGAAVRKKADDRELYKIRASGPNLPVDARSGLMLVNGIGTGFLRVSRLALQRVWDVSPEYRGDDGKLRHAAFDVRIVQGRLWSEDNVFCEKLSACGFTLYLDPAVSIGHYGVKEYRGDVRAWLEALQRAEQQARQVS